MADSLDLATLEQLLVRHCPFVAQVIWELARRHHFSGDEIAEFGQVVEHALERNDYELLRAFEGRSSWETYLATVVTRLFFRFQSERWGQWQPTFLATRLGPAAILLEELMLRDRLPLSKAIDVMRTTHRVDLPRRKLERLAVSLALVASEHGAPDPGYGAGAAGASSYGIEAALHKSLIRLSPDDRLILAMRYVDRAPLTRIAKLMTTHPRPMQRRIEQLKGVLRTSLLAEGLSPEGIDELLEDGPSPESSPEQRQWWRWSYRIRINE